MVVDGRLRTTEGLGLYPQRSYPLLYRSRHPTTSNMESSHERAPKRKPMAVSNAIEVAHHLVPEERYAAVANTTARPNKSPLR